MTLAPEVPQFGWSMCTHRSWTFTYTDSPFPAAVALDRPTPWRLARAGVAMAQPLPPTHNPTWWAQNPPRARLTQLGALWRCWRWWHTHLDRVTLRRGDLSAITPAGPPATWTSTGPWKINLADEQHYHWLITTTLTSDLWVRRSPRRRRRTITPQPPSPASRWRTLRWAHHPRGDLTWAPRPPRPAAALARRRRRIKTAINRTLLILLLGPLGLLLVLYGVGSGRAARHTLGLSGTGPTPNPYNTWGPDNPVWRHQHYVVAPSILRRYP